MILTAYIVDRSAMFFTTEILIRVGSTGNIYAFHNNIQNIVWGTLITSWQLLLKVSEALMRVVS